jgi:hypothetical protein
MNGIDAPASPAGLPLGRFQGRQWFADAVCQGLQAAASQGWSPLVLADGDFADWPLGERRVIEVLQAWAGQGRRLRLLARDFRPLREQQPRFVQWRVQWSHVIEAQAWPAAGEGEIPSAFWTPAWCVERVDPMRSVCVADGTQPRLAMLRERIDAAWQRGRPGFPASVLGL